MGGVFISYRRGDTRGSAGRLYDDLTDRFGKDLVFRDLDAIEPGAVYGTIIDRAIARCDVLIAVIGNNWIDARDPNGQRRVDSPTDLVRTEIATALAHEKVVIPVLVEDATMPLASDLPADLAPLASRNALPVSDYRWDYDVGRLVAMLDGVVGGPAAGAPAGPPAAPRTTSPGAAPPGQQAEEPAAGPPAVGSTRNLVVLAMVVLALVAAGAFAAGRNSGDGSVDPGAGTEVSSAGRSALPTGSEVLSTAPGGASPADSKGATPIAVGDTVENGNIATAGAKQRYSFAGTAGQILYLKKRYQGPCCELSWKLLAPSGAGVAGHYMDTDIGRVVLSANGTHVIEVYGNGAGTGAYGFELLAVPPDANFTVAIGDTVDNGRPAGAGNIARPGARQRYTFAGTAGQTLYLKKRYEGPCCELSWRLLAPSGAGVAGHYMDTDIGRVTLPADGTYVIEVYGNGPGTGAYGFTLTAVT